MHSKLRLRVCTWNVGSVDTPDNLSEWLLGTKSDREEAAWPDVIVVGIQEVGTGSSIPDRDPNTTGTEQEAIPQGQGGMTDSVPEELESKDVVGPELNPRCSISAAAELELVNSATEEAGIAASGATGMKPDLPNLPSKRWPEDDRTPRSRDSGEEGINTSGCAMQAAHTSRESRLRGMFDPRNRTAIHSPTSTVATSNKNGKKWLPLRSTAVAANGGASSTRDPVDCHTNGTQEVQGRTASGGWGGRFSKRLFSNVSRQTSSVSERADPPSNTAPPSDETAVLRLRQLTTTASGRNCEHGLAGPYLSPLSSTVTGGRASLVSSRGIEPKPEGDEHAGNKITGDGVKRSDACEKVDEEDSEAAGFRKHSTRPNRGASAGHAHKSKIARVGDRLKTSFKAGKEMFANRAPFSGVLGSMAQLRYGANQRQLANTVVSSLPDGYRILTSKWMWEIGIVVVVNERTMSNRVTQKPEVGNEATGIGNVLGNKGAVWAKVVVDDGTTFCFVNSHLAAHEGERFKSTRDAQVECIMRSINNGHGVPMEEHYDHIFWCGDLNYRLDAGKFPIDAVRGGENMERRGGRKKEKKVLVQRQSQYVKTLLERRDVVRRVDGNEAPERVVELERMDELKCAMRDGEVFRGFKEGALTFPPTFKVERRTGGSAESGRVQVDGEGWLRADEYKSKRTPAYCDRVLWRTKMSQGSHVKQRTYGCVPGYGTSDHKPVYATFDVVTRRLLLG